MNCGKNIRKIRKYKGLSQPEFGKLLNCSGVAICHWEKNQRHPNPKNVFLIIQQGESVGLYFKPEEIAPL